MTFTKAIVRTPGKSMVDGLTTINLGRPDYRIALRQHRSYLRALEDCGLEVTVLEADESHPDSCFVEDVALCTRNCAVITNPGATSRKGETTSIIPALRKFYSTIAFIREPETVEGGDVMQVGDHFFIGVSQRTNLKGAIQLAGILGKYNYSSSLINVSDMLHLKSGIAYLGENALLVCEKFIELDAFSNFNKIPVPVEEDYAANCIRVNNCVIIPSGFPKTRALIHKAGFKTREIDMSEFQKLEGGLSCLSLRF